MLHYCPFAHLESSLRQSLLMFAVLLACSATCAAQSAEKTGIVTESMSVDWTSADYPATAKRNNEQGTASVRIDFLNGKASGAASIAKTSGSPTLDSAAMKMISALSFKSPGTEAAPDLKKFVVDVEFGRDSVTTIGKKPCTELTADIAYFKQVNPGLKVTKMRLYELTLGMIALAGDMKNIAGMVKLSQAMPLAFDATASACEKNPDALYLDALSKALKAAN